MHDGSAITTDRAQMAGSSLAMTVRPVVIAAVLATAATAAPAATGAVVPATAR
jgi:hypothetical protein